LRVGRFSDFPFVFTIAYPEIRFKEKLDSRYVKKDGSFPARETVLLNIVLS
jgi:hypothetical protein